MTSQSSTIHLDPWGDAKIIAERRQRPPVEDSRHVLRRHAFSKFRFHAKNDVLSCNTDRAGTLTHGGNVIEL